MGRFSYYGMRAILVLYLTRAADFSDGDALRLYGAYLALLYALPVLGGALADQALGARRAVYYGAVVLVLGHAILTLDGAQLGVRAAVSPLYLALALIGIGTGLLKPTFLPSWACSTPRRTRSGTALLAGFI